MNTEHPDIEFAPPKLTPLVVVDNRGIPADVIVYIFAHVRYKMTPGS